MKWTHPLTVGILLLVAVVIATLYYWPRPAAPVNDYAACQRASGSRILATYPEQCVTKAGRSFTNPNATPVAPPRQSQ